MSDENNVILQAGVEAMLDGNRAQFADAVDAIMQSKVADLIGNIKDDLKSKVFNFEETDEVESDEEVDDIDDEETSDENEETVAA